MSAWFCEGPLHEGSRVVQNKLDRFTKRVTYMRVDGGDRHNERSLKNGRRCKACADKETNLRDQGKLQESFDI